MVGHEWGCDSFGNCESVVVCGQCYGVVDGLLVGDHNSSGAICNCMISAVNV